MAMLIFPNVLEERYSGFRDDLIQLIGQSLMFPQFWNAGDFSDIVRSSEYNYRMLYGDSYFMDTFSPAMFSVSNT
jgi:hypothetical protein